jgi:hypothetical protein
MLYPPFPGCSAACLSLCFLLQLPQQLQVQLQQWQQQQQVAMVTTLMRLLWWSGASCHLAASSKCRAHQVPQLAALRVGALLQQQPLARSMARYLAVNMCRAEVQR